MEIKVTSGDESQTTAPTLGGTSAASAAIANAPTSPSNVVEAPPAPSAPATEPATDTSEPTPYEPNPSTWSNPAAEPTPQPASTSGPSEPAPPSNPQTTQALPPKKKSKSTGIIIVAIIVALVIGGVIVFAYLKGRTKPAPAPTDQTTTQPVSSTDVTNASKSVDQDLSKADDTKDFNSNDLSDSTLGL